MDTDQPAVAHLIKITIPSRSCKAYAARCRGDAATTHLASWRYSTMYGFNGISDLVAALLVCYSAPQHQRAHLQVCSAEPAGHDPYPPPPTHTHQHIITGGSA